MPIPTEVVINGVTLTEAGLSSAGKPRFSYKRDKETVEIGGVTYTLYTNITAYAEGQSAGKAKAVKADPTVWDSETRQVQRRGKAESGEVAALKSQMKELMALVAGLTPKPAGT